MAFWKKEKRVFVAVAILAIFFAWAIVLYEIPPTEIVASVGIHNGYLLAFFSAVLGGTSILFPFPYYLGVFTLAAGGLNPFLLAVVAGTGVVIGDSTSYLVGYSGREILTGKTQLIFKRLYEWSLKKPKWVLTLVLYLYPALSPLPNDFIMIPMGLARFPYFRLIIPMWFGNMTFNLWIALAGIYGFDGIFLNG